MGTQKHRNLSVENLTVTGTFTAPEGAGQVINVTVIEETAQAPVAPHPLPIEKLTMVALEARVEFLTSVLVEAGLIARPQARPTEADPRMTALLEAPEGPAEDAPAPEGAEGDDEGAEGQA